MRMLVLGGTVFLSRAVAAEALRRGHEVVCAARGKSGAVPEGAQLVAVDRDAPDALAPLAGARFDAVIDVAKDTLGWVSEALRVLAVTARHWTFVSTINVYADTATPGQTPDAPLLEPIEDDADAKGTSEYYGAIKVASENAVREVMGERAFVVRPGLITGPGDISDRFGYWPARMSLGGGVLVPDVPVQFTQYVDVRDLAAWLVDAGEQRLTGTFDGIGPAQPLPELLRGIADAVGGDVELTPVGEAALAAAGVTPWSGPKSLPLWCPPSHHGFCAHDAGPALAAGLTLRPLADAVTGAFDHERALGLDRERKAGLTLADEAEVLGALERQ
jgi:nucleoside-diphosphate-sugar epimerase